MGGSSLAPDIFRRIFGVEEGFLDLAVLDSTSPEAVQVLTEKVDFHTTIFIVSTKSGGTVETLSFMKHFFNLAIQEIGLESASAHFVAITDPGSRLEKTAREHNFREIFLNDPNIGGRYSALSYFGLVPAALLGVDVHKILQRAISMSAIDHLGGTLGTILGVAANHRRDKVTFIIDDGFRSFGDWVEQLIAESTGKEGRGILPVVTESVGEPAVYGEDRLFVYIQLSENGELGQGVSKLKNAGHPVVKIQLTDLYDLGGQFFLWELATAVACYQLKVNPFNQPDVESAKVLARKMVSKYQESGELPVGETAKSDNKKLSEFLPVVHPGDYIALQAYLHPTDEITTAFQNLRIALRERYKVATTLGFGPRFLHSTGQLHKGDAGDGLFIQFITNALDDVPIPDELGENSSTITFGALILAQAYGDGQALIGAGRRFIRFVLPPDAAAEHINRLIG
jgi:hypothetical protein